MMNIRRVIAAGATAAILAGPMLFGAGASVAAGPGDWDYVPTDPEYVSGTPDGVKVWMNNCYVVEGKLTPGMFNGQVTHPGRHYGCNMGIEVSAEYEQKHGPYTVSAEAIGATATFRALGAPYAGLGGPGVPPCEPGVVPHYLGIAAAGEAGTYGSDAGGFHMNLYDVACYFVNEFPPDPEPPVLPEPEPEDSPVAGEDPAPIVDPEPVNPRAVPEVVKTGVGPAEPVLSVPQNVASLHGMWNAEDQAAPTIRELLAMLKNAPPQATPVLSLPAPRAMPFAEVLEPTTFEDLWVIDDPANGYSRDGAQFFLAHTHTRGGAIGNAVNEAGLTSGTAVEIAGVRYDVASVSTVVKPDIGTLPIWHSADPDDAFLIVCLWNNGSLATHNLVIELHRA